MTGSAGHHWTLLTNHGSCLLLLASRADVTVSEMAQLMQITERSAARILSDLRADGYITVRREGRRNRYLVSLDAPLRHSIVQKYRVRDLLGGILACAEAPGSVQSVAALGDLTPGTSSGSTPPSRGGGKTSEKITGETSLAASLL